MAVSGNGNCGVILDMWGLQNKLLSFLIKKSLFKVQLTKVRVVVYLAEEMEQLLV